MPEDLETAWSLVRAELRRDVPDFSFQIWLEPLEPVALEDGVLFLRAPDHILTWVRERYLAALVAAAGRALGRAQRVEIVDEAWTSSRSGGEVLEEEGGDRDRGERLNPKYTFEQFVISDGSRFAHAAALAVAELPSQAYNPLFIYGRPGIGKTHLLHAIGNYVRRFGHGMTVRYTTVETFTAEFVAAVRHGGGSGFKERFRQLDLLLVDDVQFLRDKTRTQEEFFHTFNALYEAGSQIVLTSDRPPAELGELEARIKERFAAGLVADLAPPDFEARMAILRKRARHDRLGATPDDVLAELAHRITTSVRALEGALIRVVAYASLRGEPLDAQTAGTVLDRLYPSAPPVRTIEEITSATAAAFGLTIDELLAYDRRPNVSAARQVAMYLARELTDRTLPEIGRSFGGRNHATVLHAHRKVAAAVSRETEAGAKVRRLRADLAGDELDRTQ